MRVLRTPPSLTYTNVTFPEGFTLEKMSQRLSAKLPRTDPTGLHDRRHRRLDALAAAARRGRHRWKACCSPTRIESQPTRRPVTSLSAMVDLMDLVVRQEDVDGQGRRNSASARTR